MVAVSLKKKKKKKKKREEKEEKKKHKKRNINKKKRKQTQDIRTRKDSYPAITQSGPSSSQYPLYFQLVQSSHLDIQKGYSPKP